MKVKIALFGVGIILLLLISGYIENNYCHVWVTQEPAGVSVNDRHTTGFCNLNQYTGLVGSFILNAFQVIK